MLVVLTTTSIQQSLRGNNSEINSKNFTSVLIESNTEFNTQNLVKNTIYELSELFTIGDRKIKIIIINSDDKIAIANIKIVSPFSSEEIGPYYIEEGNIYEYIVPDISWYIEVINISENSEINYWNE